MSDDSLQWLFGFFILTIFVMGFWMGYSLKNASPIEIQFCPASNAVGVCKETVGRNVFDLDTHCECIPLNIRDDQGVYSK